MQIKISALVVACCLLGACSTYRGNALPKTQECTDLHNDIIVKQVDPYQPKSLSAKQSLYTAQQHYQDMGCRENTHRPFSTLFHTR